MEQQSSDSTFPACSGSICNWANLSTDLTELILSLLPLKSIVVSGAVCKFWKSIINDPSFASRISNAVRFPWLFFYGQNNIQVHRNQAFTFDPASNEWILLPPVDNCHVGVGGFLFARTARSTFRYTPLLRTCEDQIWLETPPLRFSRLNPIIGVLNRQGTTKFIFAGGVRFFGGLVDIEEERAVDIFDAHSNTWLSCAPLPHEFSGYSFRELSSALIGTNSFYIFGIHSCLLARFDLSLHSWSGVRILRPPGALFSFLVSCGDWLILAGLRIGPPPSFALWRTEIDGDRSTCVEIGEMPHKMLHRMFFGEDDERFASLRCAGTDGLLYVFNEAPHGGYPACVCEISSRKWRELPKIPFPVDRLHRVDAFCSSVNLESVLIRS